MLRTVVIKALLKFKEDATMKKRSRRSNLKMQLVIIGVFLILGIAFIGYLTQVKKYQNIFNKNTIINDKDCSLLTIEEAEKIVQGDQKYELEIVFKENEKEYISGEEIGLELDNLHQELTEIKSQQSKDLLFRGGEYYFDITTYDEEMLKTVLLDKKQLDKKFMKRKTKIKYKFNSDSKRFEAKQKESYYLKFDEVFEKVAKAVEEKLSTVSVEDLYYFPKNNKTLDKLNSYIDSEVIYNLPLGKEYVLDSTTLYTWLVKDDKGNYSKDKDIWNKKLEDFVKNELSSMCNTIGIAREFRPTGKDGTVLVSGGDYGSKLDIEAEIQKLKEDLKNHTTVTRNPIYEVREVSSKNNGLGETYVEIDLTRQKVWVYQNGKLVIETNCVTGCVNKGHSTPTGIFTLTYKQMNKVLRGRIQANGKYEYESPVSYWMPFNGGIGLHDATWRSSFGGNIYITNGSHGCINLPLEAARSLYQIIDKDMPIIVYKS